MTGIIMGPSLEEQEMHAKARMLVSVMLGAGHKPDRKMLRFNDIVTATTGALATISPPETARARRRLSAGILIEMTEMCFPTCRNSYIAGKGPMYELQAYQSLHLLGGR